MTIEEVLSIMEKDVTVRIYFNDFSRGPIYGKFVKTKDHDEIIKKGQVRFVGANRFEEYSLTEHVICTRLHQVSNFKFIKTFENAST